MKDFNHFQKTISFLLILFILNIVSLNKLNAQSKNKKKIDESALHLVGNKELLKEAQIIFKKANDAFLASLRGVNRYQNEFATLKNASNTLKPLGETVPGINSKTEELEAVKRELDYSKLRIETLIKIKTKLELTETSLTKYIDHLVAAMAAVQIYDEAYKLIRLYLYEIDLRVKDGSLSLGEIPNNLRIPNINITTKLQELNIKEAKTQSEKYTIAVQLKEIDLNILTLKSQTTTLEDNYNNELNRKNTEKELRKLTTSNLVNKLTQIKKNIKEQKHAYRLSIKGYDDSKLKISEIKQTLDSIKVPDADKLSQTMNITKCETAETTIVAFNEIISYQNVQLKLLKKHTPLTEKMLKHIVSLEKEISELMKLFYKIDLIHTIISEQVSKEKLSKIFSDNHHPDSLLVLQKELSKMHSNIFLVQESSKIELLQTTERTNMLKSTQEQMLKKLLFLKLIHGATVKVKEWEAGLNETKVNKIISDFTVLTDSLSGMYKNIEVYRENNKEKKTAFDEARKKYEALEDPLIQEIREKIFSEQQHILSSLYVFANIKITEKAGKQKRKDKTAKKLSKTNKSVDAEPLIVDLKSYQKLMSTQFELIDKRKEYKTELAESLTKLDSTLEKYNTYLIKTYTVVHQQYKSLLALKNNLSKNKIKKSELPANYNELLKSKNINLYEAEVLKSYNELLKEQLLAKQMLTNLMKTNVTRDSIEKFTIHVASFVGNKYDILGQYQETKNKLNKIIDYKKDKTALKLIEQQAEQRITDDNNIQETLLGLFPSSQPESLIELMIEYYKELLELENKQKKLDAMKEKLDRLAKLSQDELLETEKLIPLMNKYILNLENKYAEEWASSRISLNPDLANKIMKNFENERGYRFTIPTPITEKYKIGFIKEVAKRIYELKVSITAAKKQLQIFEKRLETKIEKENEIYKNELSLITFEEFDIQRRIRFLIGRSDKELEKITEDELPKDKLERLRFLKGELGILRDERMKNQKSEWLFLLVKILVIILLTILLIKLIRFLSKALEQRAEKKGKLTAQSKVLYSLMASIIKFLVWVVSVMTILSSIGINVTTLVAGLGIGGIAIAMASKETISDLLSGITIFMTKPFKIGDFIKYKDGTVGKVLDIRFRYTKLQEFSSNNLVVIPNSRLAGSEVTNISHASKVGARRGVVIPLSKQNTLEQIELAKKLISDMLIDRNDLKIIYIRLKNFEDNSFNIQVLVEFTVKSGFIGLVSEIHIEIVKILKENNIEFFV